MPDRAMVCYADMPVRLMVRTSIEIDNLHWTSDLIIRHENKTTLNRRAVLGSKCIGNYSHIIKRP